jgi:phosphomannomutase
MGSFLDSSSIRYKTYLMPCNGTKLLWPPSNVDEEHKLLHNKSMEDHLGEKDYRILLQELIYSQIDISSEGIPLTGHFIDCRGSTINWCPIGRNANNSQREDFMKIDKEGKIRNRVLTELRTMLEQKGLLKKVTIKLGGDTSFDIYPKGWDKTYGLKHFSNWDVWFVGDRCYPDGNDYEIYKECCKKDQGFITSGPEQTAEIIDEIIEKIRRD